MNIKKIAIYIATGFLCSGFISLILTPAFETEGNIFDKFGIVSDCISFKREVYISDTTLKIFMGIFIVYILSLVIYESGRENKRTNEEYGSAVGRDKAPSHVGGDEGYVHDKHYVLRI